MAPSGLGSGSGSGHGSGSASDFWRRVEASAGSVSRALGREVLPDTLVVLGSGFKGFEDQLGSSRRVDLADVDHMPVPKVEGHGASLVVGEIKGRAVAVMTGRVHLYEGWAPADVVYPLRVLSTLGVQRVLLTNAAGSVDAKILPGSVILVRDHLNLTGMNCLIGADAREIGPIFQDMSACYDKEWRAGIAAGGGVTEGVYAGLTGPTYETPAETAMLRGLGAHVVGMSTVQEAIAARQLKMRVACLSFVTNLAGGLGGQTSHGEVLDLASRHRSALHGLIARAVTVDS
jgi:purine-nucleoside phosphorylase